MDKISTRSTFSSQQSATGAVRPNRMTLEKLKQFARAYSYSRPLGKLGDMVLN